MHLGSVITRGIEFRRKTQWCFATKQEERELHTYIDTASLAAKKLDFFANYRDSDTVRANEFFQTALIERELRRGFV